MTCHDSSPKVIKNLSLTQRDCDPSVDSPHTALTIKNLSLTQRDCDIYKLLCC